MEYWKIQWNISEFMSDGDWHTYLPTLDENSLFFTKEEAENSLFFTEEEAEEKITELLADDKTKAVVDKIIEERKKDYVSKIYRESED